MIVLMFIDLVNLNSDPSELRSMVLQQDMAQTWRRLDPTSETMVVPSIQDAVEFIRRIDDGKTEIDVFVTGSFHLVGGMVTVLEGV